MSRTDLVRDELAAVEILLDGQTQAGPPCDVIAQQLTGRDVRDAEVRGDQRALSALACHPPAPGGATISTRILTSSPHHLARRPLGRY
jgi:hypothetical protein